MSFLPGLAFSVFYCMCIFGRHRQAWHQRVWKLSIWWSGIWLGCFVLGFVIPLASFGGPLTSLMYVALIPAGWSEACGINPFLAVGLHLLAWGCSRDASSNEILVAYDPCEKETDPR
ncbi:hypothetical protein JIN84_04170 [Luteolibacter yonseiensis]|uniref:Uncharacterized protein n=1 Tax=Luteolibacter yonseiensis TaxID=1144680 RepID=A0A934R0T6_9BACT|nr:hypothetical protein [Luteolibacter yonseiensis]MBK1814796.1 hypothetical protein [Luteolibacter yonseiensis]